MQQCTLQFYIIVEAKCSTCQSQYCAEEGLLPSTERPTRNVQTNSNAPRQYKRPNRQVFACRLQCTQDTFFTSIANRPELHVCFHH